MSLTPVTELNVFQFLLHCPKCCPVTQLCLCRVTYPTDTSFHDLSSVLWQHYWDFFSCLIIESGMGKDKERLLEYVQLLTLIPVPCLTLILVPFRSWALLGAALNFQGLYQ